MHRAQATADVFRAIADPTRRAILDHLRQGARPVNSIAGAFHQSRPAISKHLKILREAGVVTEERSGRERLYRLDPGHLRDVDAWIDGYRAFWQRNLDSLKTYLEERK